MNLKLTADMSLFETVWVGCWSVLQSIKIDLICQQQSLFNGGHLLEL
jgi:hypothetical protein